MHPRLIPDPSSRFPHSRPRARKLARHPLRVVARPTTADAKKLPTGPGQLAFLLSRCAVVAFLLLFAFTGRSPASPAATDPVLWPDRGPYESVGGSHGDVIKMPAPVVETLRHMLHDDPSTWRICQIRGPFTRRHLVVTVVGAKAWVFLLVERKLWINLCADIGLPFVNDVARPLYLADLHDEEKLENYLTSVGYFHWGECVPLTKHFQHRNTTTKEDVREWLNGDRKPSDLIALCHDPVVTTNRDKATIRCNTMLGNGAVEQWTLRLRVGKVMYLEAIEKIPLRKKDTFHYPLIH